MKTLKPVLIALLAILTLNACKNEPKKSSTEKTNIEVAPEIKKPVKVESKTSFHKVLTLQNISFDIKVTGEGSIRQLTIQPKGLGVDNPKLEHQIEGEVVDAEIEDLNSDGFPEVLIYTTSAGSGSYGNVIGYSVNDGKSVTQIYFPELADNKKANTGYMGHDKFAIVETTFIRKFPIYNEGDTNNNPTGKTRSIQYKLRNGEAGRKFVINKVVEY